jgi:hypothetical protein
MFPIYVGKCFSHKVVHNWVEKFSQGRSKVTDDDQPGHSVETARDATEQQVEGLIQAERRIMIDSVENSVGCSHGSMQHNT